MGNSPQRVYDDTIYEILSYLPLGDQRNLRLIDRNMRRLSYEERYINILRNKIIDRLIDDLIETSKYVRILFSYDSDGEVILGYFVTSLNKYSVIINNQISDLNYQQIRDLLLKSINDNHEFQFEITKDTNTIWFEYQDIFDYYQSTDSTGEDYWTIVISPKQLIDYLM